MQIIYRSRSGAVIITVLWLALQTNQITSAETQIVDRGASNATRRYYRSRLWP